MLTAAERRIELVQGVDADGQVDDRRRSTMPTATDLAEKSAVAQPAARPAQRGRRWTCGVVLSDGGCRRLAYGNPLIAHAESTTHVPTTPTDDPRPLNAARIAS